MPGKLEQSRILYPDSLTIASGKLSDPEHQVFEGKSGAYKATIPTAYSFYQVLVTAIKPSFLNGSKCENCLRPYTQNVRYFSFWNGDVLSYKITTL